MVLAPAAGVVVNVVNDFTENHIGDLPPEKPGNLIIIDHLNGEYSVLAHMKKSSISVSEGDTVRSGQMIGLCGNNGYSFGPHIHFHMQL